MNSTNESFELTDAEKRVLDLQEKQYENGEIKGCSREEIKQKLMLRIKKEETGNGVYHDAREVVEKIKEDIKSKK
jgi:hypothetical protein